MRRIPSHRPTRCTRSAAHLRASFYTALVVTVVALGPGACAPVPPAPPHMAPERELTLMGYSIQVGAFSHVDNAIRLTAVLEGRGLNAYYFHHPAGLYKVRFGDYASRESAVGEAERLLAAGIIDEYYIVSPEEYAVARERKLGKDYLRGELVTTARSFIGLPYRWGGDSVEEGFDCSGLTMAVYHLNGLNLPRSAAEQYLAGAPVDQGQLLQGDLVFFATSGRRKVSHVGVYAGEGKFIHSPGVGKTIRTDVLADRYYAARYLGARTYIR
jgi:cell wall-associated NlpC family hydrolase